MLFGMKKKKKNRKSNPYIHTHVTHFESMTIITKNNLLPPKNTAGEIPPKKHGGGNPPKKTWQGKERKNQSSFQPYML